MVSVCENHTHVKPMTSKGAICGRYFCFGLALRLLYRAQGLPSPKIKTKFWLMIDISTFQCANLESLNKWVPEALTKNITKNGGCPHLDNCFLEICLLFVLGAG